MSDIALNDGFLGMMASGSMSMFYNQVIPSSSSEGYEENAMREGFREAFQNEFRDEVSLSLSDDLRRPGERTGEPNIRLFPRARATPAPQIKAVPPPSQPSQPTKPIINEQGRVKRAFDFDT
jgi:hypothetical protein